MEIDGFFFGNEKLIIAFWLQSSIIGSIWQWAWFLLDKLKLQLKQITVLICKSGCWIVQNFYGICTTETIFVIRMKSQ